MSYSLHAGGPTLAGLISVHSPTQNGSVLATLIVVLVEQRHI